MFVQQRGSDWLVLEWQSDGGPIRPVIISQHDTQQLALDAMEAMELLKLKLMLDAELISPQQAIAASGYDYETVMREIAERERSVPPGWGTLSSDSELPNTPLAERGFGVNECTC